MKAANTKPGMMVARGAMARGGSPTAAMVSAAMGTPTIMLASMCLLVFMGMLLIMSMALVIMSLLSAVEELETAEDCVTTLDVVDAVEAVVGAGLGRLESPLLGRVNVGSRAPVPDEVGDGDLSVDVDITEVQVLG